MQRSRLWAMRGEIFGLGPMLARRYLIEGTVPAAERDRFILRPDPK